ncbi:MAG: hypothetical protein M8352_07645 [ANME-2 cluster archaeon]|nr:hypothetical protein [ANME-2 cluster archaeon]
MLRDNVSVDTLRLLMGQTEVDTVSVSEEILLLARAIDDPYSLPYLIEELNALEITDEELVRFALVRVQIDSELRMNEDIQMHQRRRFVAQVIEKLLFGEVLIEMGAPLVEI